jgi:hypothetical protein
MFMNLLTTFPPKEGGTVVHQAAHYASGRSGFLSLQYDGRHPHVPVPLFILNPKKQVQFNQTGLSFHTARKGAS